MADSTPFSMDDVLSRKHDRLARRLGELPGLAVAFSGGCDSAFLLWCARQALGSRAMALTVDSPVLADSERRAARDLCAAQGFPHAFVPLDIMAVPGFVENSPRRCYFCKQAMCRALWEAARSLGISHLAHGANTDDMAAGRPGQQAADEAGVVSPLADAGFSKADVRAASSALGLDTAAKPAMPCLATRIPYGSEVTAEKLRVVEAAEAFLAEQGANLCRVRHHGTVAVIEVPEPSMGTIINNRQPIVDRLRDLGFAHVTLDLFGHESGSQSRPVKGHR